MNYIDIKGKRLVGGLFRELLDNSLKFPIFGVQIREAQGNTEIKGANGFVSWRDGKLFFEATKDSLGIENFGFGMRLEEKEKTASGYRKLVPRSEPVGTLQTVETHGYQIEGTTFDGETLRCESLDLSSNLHSDGRGHWTTPLYSLELWKDTGPSFRRLLELKPDLLMPKGAKANVKAVVHGKSSLDSFDLTIKVQDQKISCSYTKLEDDISILTLLAEGSVTNRRYLAELFVEAIAVATSEYRQVLGFVDEQGLETHVTLCPGDGLKDVIVGNRPVRGQKNMMEIVRLYVNYFAQDSPKNNSLRQTVVRQLMSSDQYQPIREFVLCSSIEGFVTLLEPSKDEAESQVFEALKNELTSILERTLETEEDPTRNQCLSRFRGVIKSTNYFTARQKFAAQFAKRGSSWDDGKLGHAWSKLRNPAAHGRQGGQNQKQVHYFLASIELWHRLLLTEIGFQGPIIEYSAKTAYHRFPETQLKCDTAPERVKPPKQTKFF